MKLPLRYLLDTNIISDLVRHPRGSVASKIASVGEGSICTSIVVAAELRYGAEKSQSNRLSERIDLILSALEILPFEPPADRHYGSIRNQLSRMGTPIGPNDLLIAAHSIAANLTLVTANIREFSRVPALGVENWMES